MKTLPLSEAKAQLSRLVDAVDARDERVTITRNGRPAAVIMSADELASWQATHELTSAPDFMASIRRGIRDLEAGRVIDEDELRALLGAPKAARRRGTTKRTQSAPRGRR